MFSFFYTFLKLYRAFFLYGAVLCMQGIYCSEKIVCLQTNKSYKILCTAYQEYQLNMQKNTCFLWVQATPKNLLFNCLVKESLSTKNASILLEKVTNYLADTIIPLELCCEQLYPNFDDRFIAIYKRWIITFKEECALFMHDASIFSDDPFLYAKNGTYFTKLRLDIAKDILCCKDTVDNQWCKNITAQYKVLNGEIALVNSPLDALFLIGKMHHFTNICIEPVLLLYDYAMEHNKKDKENITTRRAYFFGLKVGIQESILDLEYRKKSFFTQSPLRDMS